MLLLKNSNRADEAGRKERVIRAVEGEAGVSEAFRLRQGGIADEAVGPEVSDTDFQLIGSFFQIIRNFHFVRLFPEGTDILSVHNDFGYVLHVTQTQERTLCWIVEGEFLYISSRSGEIADTGVFGLREGVQGIENGYGGGSASFLEGNMPRTGENRFPVRPGLTVDLSIGHLFVREDKELGVIGLGIPTNEGAAAGNREITREYLSCFRVPDTQMASFGTERKLQGGIILRRIAELNS